MSADATGDPRRDAQTRSRTWRYLNDSLTRLLDRTQDAGWRVR